MNKRLKNAYNKVINAHHSAVQTDTLLEHTDDWKLEKKSKIFWAQYNEAAAEFQVLLSLCTLPDEVNNEQAPHDVQDRDRSARAQHAGHRTPR